MRVSCIGMRVLSGRHAGDGAIIHCDGAGAWDNTIFTMWVRCRGAHDRGGGGRPRLVHITLSLTNFTQDSCSANDVMIRTRECLQLTTSDKSECVCTQYCPPVLTCDILLLPDQCPQCPLRVTRPGQL